MATGSRPGFSRTSQLRVKLGMMRPPISEISSTTTAMPTRMLILGCALEVGLEMERHVAEEQHQDQDDDTEIVPLLAGDDFAGAAAATIKRKLISTSIAASQPVYAENVTQTRPAVHSATRTISGRPRSGSRPVQFGIAVNKNPVITAGRKP